MKHTLRRSSQIYRTKIEVWLLSRRAAKTIAQEEDIVDLPLSLLVGDEGDNYMLAD
jgi:hypothetical protein